ncbi:MBL fold metallo-hydrolase [Oscillibacter sp.]|uniref:MBL fold metallo-hydrolase n=1 Tax=Oscillibacter sp. TaxID=1945593 RepID=UPI00339A9182
MRVTFLAHSGFLVELDSVCLLLDWWKGELPELPDKPLFCFASHQHHDHFNPQIFSLDDGRKEIRFLLGKDIQLSAHNRKKWNLSDVTAEKCAVLSGNEKIDLPHGVTVETLPSTDEGVAFLMTCEEKTIYHAGDLNWWHWEGEDKAWNRNMETDFKRFVEPLRGRRIDLAFAPLDPRQEGAADWGLRYLLELAEVKKLIPMHQWEDYRPTEAFLRALPQWAETVLPVERLGQQWIL